MEKKTFTSLAIITFLMTSTAVLAMNTDEEKPGAPSSTVQLKQIPSTPPKKGLSFFGLFSWGASDSSTSEAIPASMPSSAPATDPHSQNSTPTTEDFMRASMSLTHDQLQVLKEADISNDPKTHKDAEEILSSALQQSAPLSAPVESLSQEQKRTFWSVLRDMFWGTEPTVEASTSTGGQPSSSSIDSTPPVKTFRTTGANPNAKNKHSAVSIQLPKQGLQSDLYELVVNHRTGEKGPIVRIYNPITRTYEELDALPNSVDFRDTLFNITGWAKAVHDHSSSATEVTTYLSFMNGKSDIHSFKIQSRGNTLKNIVLGDTNSESQIGIHVYGPETDRDANEWSTMQSEDLSQ